jgi:hypothetical protein
MRTITKLFATSACMLLMGAPLAVANQSDQDIAEMRAIVEQLQSQVEAQSEQIEHQGDVIRDARLEQSREDDSRFGASGITSFLQRLEIEGWVAGSWFWNFNNPPEGAIPQWVANNGISGNVYPFHGAHNNFQVDQVWFGLEHPIDEENRAGFRFDLVYGTTAANLGNAAPVKCALNDCGSSYYISQAFIQYLIPFTSNGITMKAGKFNTLVGAEVAQATANFNITRGAVYSIMQPIDHTGVLFDTRWGESGFTTAFGVVNSGLNGFPNIALGGGGGGGIFFSGSDGDVNDDKSVIGQLGWNSDTFGAAVTAIWGKDISGFVIGGGGNISRNDRSQGLIDLVLTWDPNERISTWLNFDYGWAKPGGQTQHGYGVAVAGRYAVTERMGISTRFEWVADKNGFAGWVANGNKSDLFTLTGTADYALTNNLMLRGEVRWDTIRKAGGTDDEFWDRGVSVANGGNFKRDQVTTGLELVYEF